MRFLLRDALVLCLLAAPVFPAAAETPPAAPAAVDESLRQSLEGLQEIYVSVAPVSKALADGGVSPEALRQDAEKALQAAGVKLLTEEDYKRSAARAELRIYLHGSVSHMTPEGKPLVYAVGCTVELLQKVVVVNNRKTLQAATWRSGFVASLGYPRLKAQSQADIAKQVQKFIAELKAANPAAASSKGGA
jgi:hypothetical protein